MTNRTFDTLARLRPLRLLPMLLAVPALSLGACTNPDQFLPSYQPGVPQGNLGGTVTYSGPMPCTENQHVVGAAVLLAFDTRLLPPPEGLGTTAASLASVGGDQLFGGIYDRLTFNDDGTKWCPAPNAPPVTVSADWTIGPLPGGEYEVRGFYDVGGTFNPVFSITKLPVKGDIAGGAIDNVADVLLGKEPVYRRIALGVQDPTTGQYTIPPTGSNIDGVSVALALPLPTGLPIFYPSKVEYPSWKCNGTMPVSTTPATSDPTDITIKSDFQLAIYSPANPSGTEQSLVRVTVSSGVLPGEVSTAVKPPFDLPVNPPDKFTYSWQDVNQDNNIDITNDHSAASDLLPALLPLTIFSKLTQSMPSSPTDDLTAQASPAVILQGVTIYQSLLNTITWSPSPNPNDPSNSRTSSDVTVGITPAVVCMNPTDFAPDAMAVLVVAHPTDCAGNALLANEQDTLKALRKQFGRDVTVATGCMPQGRYALNLVYGTGQAWSNPNEAGVCGPLEPESNGKCVASVGSRPLLPSQHRVLTIAGPDDPTYCTMNPVPSCCTDATQCKCPGGKCTCPGGVCP